MKRILLASLFCLGFGALMAQDGPKKKKVARISKTQSENKAGQSAREAKKILLKQGEAKYNSTTIEKATAAKKD